MNNKQMNGIAVITIADGKKLGTVDTVRFDPASRRVVGFAVRAEGSGPLSGNPNPVGTVDAGAVHSLGPDALTLADASALRGGTTADGGDALIDLDALTKRKTVTEGGTFVGQVAAIDVDERTFQLRSIEVSPGFFKGNKTIPAAQVVSIGDDVLVVADAVCAPDHGADAVAGERRFVVGDVGR